MRRSGWFVIGALCGVILWSFAECSVLETKRTEGSGTGSVDDIVEDTQKPGTTRRGSSTENMHSQSDACSAEKVEIARTMSQIRAVERGLKALPSPQSKVPSDLNARCTPIPWPSGLPEEYRYEKMLPMLARAFSEREFELDCSEFPCITLVHGAPSGPDEIATLRTGEYSDSELIQRGFGTRGRQYHFIALLPVEAANRHTRARIRARFDARSRDLMDQGADEEYSEPSPTGDTSMK